MDSEKLLILVATMTGTALMAAEDIAEYCSENNIETNIIEIDNAEINILTEAKNPVLICTHLLSTMIEQFPAQTESLAPEPFY